MECLLRSIKLQIFDKGRTKRVSSSFGSLALLPLARYVYSLKLEPNGTDLRADNCARDPDDPSFSVWCTHTHTHTHTHTLLLCALVGMRCGVRVSGSSSIRVGLRVGLRLHEFYSVEFGLNSLMSMGAVESGLGLGLRIRGREGSRFG